MTTVMKSPSILTLGLGTLMLTISACQVWHPPAPPPPHRNGASLDTPPPEGTRYMDGPATVTGPNYPDAPRDPSQPQAPLTNPDGTISTPPPVDPSVPQPPVVNNTPPPDTAPPPSPKPLPQPKAELPVGIKVPNKPGFVYSPYDKTAGIVDVTGFAPGTKVKCPYTNKVFLVP